MKKASKLIAIALTLALSLSLLAACGSNGGETAQKNDAASTQPASTTTPSTNNSNSSTSTTPSAGANTDTAPTATTTEPEPQPEPEPEPEPENVCAFAGEYEVICTNPEGEEIYFEEFIIENDGTIHGVGDASGMSTLEGSIDEEGNYHCDYVRLGGTMDGTIDADGNLTGVGEIRGRNYTYVGSLL